MRFFDELFHPEKKCDRIGHNGVDEISYWYADTWKAEELLEHYSSYRSVAEKLKKTEKVCLRCHKILDTKWKHINSIQSFTYSGTEFEETGLTRAD
jgi:hypothetical protein